MKLVGYVHNICNENDCLDDSFSYEDEEGYGYILKKINGIWKLYFHNSYSMLCAAYRECDIRNMESYK